MVQIFNGKIDDIKIWNVALDSSQVLMRSSLVRLDTSIPTIPSVTLSSSNNSQNLAKPGDNLTLDFTVSEDIPQPTVNLAGHAVIPSNSIGDGKTWQAVYTVDNTTLNENVSFNIGFSDAAGNIGDNVTTVTSGTPILVDTEVPTLSNVQLVSNNLNNTSLVKVGEQIILSFKSSESIDNPLIKIIRENVNVIGNENGTEWTASYYVLPGDDQEPLNNGLIAHYQFEENANDLSTSGFHGTEIGNVLYVDRENEKAVQLSGGAHIKIPHDDAFKVSQFSIALWVNKNSASGYLLSKGQDCRNSIIINGNGNGLRLGYGTSWCAADSSYTSLDLNQWYYITGTVDETNIRYYLNGEEVHTATNKNFFASNNYPLIIGRHYTNSDGGGGYHYNFSGKVDEIRFYNRSLSADEVTELYRLETNPTPEQHYYQFRLADFSIEFQDLAGNMGDPVDNTSDGSIVDIDTSIPELESVKIESSNSSTLGAKDQLARFGDNITLKVTSKEPLSTLEYLDEENNLIPFVSEDSSRIKWNLSRNVLLEEEWYSQT